MNKRSRRVSTECKFEAVIFDIDGTTWDIFPIYYEAVKQGLEKYDIPTPSMDFLIALLKSGESFSKKLTKMGESHGLRINIDDLLKEIKHIFNVLEEREVQPYPGVTSLFSQLKNRNIKIGMATGRFASRERIRRICRRMEIDHFVDAVTSQRYVQNPKPAPDLIIECARRLETPPEKGLVVGDTRDDILAAKGAGATAIGVVSGIDNYREMMALKPLAVVKSLEDILHFV